MAVSIDELIQKKEAIAAGRRQQFDLDTSIGKITVKTPSRSFVAEASNLEDSDAYLIVQCVVEPNLSDKKLMEAYGCHEPTDIVEKLFKAGEIIGISKVIMKCAGFGEDIRAELHETAKN